MKSNNIVTLALVGGLFFCALSSVAEPALNLTSNSNVISLAPLDTPFLPAYGCINDASTKCLDFGTENGESVSGISFTKDGLGPWQSEGATTFRELQANKSVVINFNAFNVDAAGNLLSPMLLEARFKDTITNPPSNVQVFSKIHWTNLDKGFAGYGLLDEVPILGLGHNGDNIWQHAQYGFEKNAFQLLRVVDGLFSLRISLFTANSTLSLPIDYITLRAISEDDYQALASQGRKFGGFVQLNPPKDEPSPLISYSNSALTVFPRDPMRPIYPKTKPAAKEINQPLHAVSAPGELEPFQLGLYSQKGIDGVTVAISDLKNARIGASIPSSASAIYKVVYAEKRLVPRSCWGPYNAKYYGLQPDHLGEFDQISIPLDSSQAIWLKLRVPDKTPPGLYQGKISILQAGVIKATVPLKLEVLPLRLDPPKTRTSAFHDPYFKVFSSDQNKVFELFRDVGFDPFITSTVTSLDGIVIKDPNTNKIIDFDFEIFGFEPRLTRLIDEGIIKQNPIYIYVGTLAYSIFVNIFNVHLTEKIPDLYDKLNNPDFKNAFILGINKIEAIGKKYGVTFAFSALDEPGSDPFQRILADRLYTHLKENNSLTTVTYYPSCDEEISSGDFFQTPTGKIPPLTKLIDYKLWELSTGQKAGYEAHLIEPSSPFGYYTTNAAYLRNPIYNRFLHGLFAFRVDAESVVAYALGDWVSNPYDDFDPTPWGYSCCPDFIFAYPTWSGKMLMVMGAEGMREGIKDSKYLATLQRLISVRSGTAVAQQASEYLNKLMKRIKTDYSYATGYDSDSNFGEYGYYEAILKDISESGNDHDFEAFTSFRDTAAAYIKKLATQGLPR